MPTVEEVTGQARLIDAILAEAEMPGRQALRLEGASGTGKSWVLDQVARRWSEAGHAALLARSHEEASQRPLYPWLQMTIPGKHLLARQEVLRGSLVKGGRAVPFIGHLASYILEEVTQRRRKRLDSLSGFLDEQEQDILFTLQACTGRKRLMLIVDDLQWWDRESVNVLRMILSGQLDGIYEILSDVVIVVAGEDPAGEVLNSIHSTGLRLERIGRTQLPALLAAFGFKGHITDATLDTIHNTCNGDVGLIRDLALHLALTPEDLLDALPASAGKLIEQIIQHRMQSLGNDRQSIQELLEKAAVIGLAFSDHEILCMMQWPDADIWRAVTAARRERLLDPASEVHQFSNETMYKHFHSQGSKRHQQHHSRFADCLRELRSGDYLFRARHLEQAGRDEEASVCRVLHHVRRLRLCLPEAYSSAVSEPLPEPLKGYLDGMARAYRHFHDRRLREAEAILEGIEAFLPLELLVERDQLRAQILLKSIRKEDYQRARALLEENLDQKDTEPEIWSRTMQILLVVCVQCDDLDAARRVDRELNQFYYRRRGFDPDALHELNVLRRRAECLFKLPIATQRLRKASAYFGPIHPGGVPRNPTQYYYSKTNLLGNLIVGGELSEARSVAESLYHLLHDFDGVAFPNTVVAANNILLHEFVSGAIAPGEARKVMEGLLDEQLDADHQFLLRNNLAVYMLLSGDLDAGTDLLERMHKRLRGQEMDAYHTYFVGTNLAGALLVKGDRERARALWQEHAPLVDRFYPAAKEVMAQRHSLIGEAMGTDQPFTVEAWNGCLDEQPEQVNPSWPFYRRGFLLTDVQFWSAT